MILGWERTAANRQIVRDRLCDVAYRCRCNRAFLWLMHSSGEIKGHMGLHGLEDSYCDLLDMLGHTAAFAGHHGDGVGIVEVNHHGSGVIAAPQPADCPPSEVTKEELEAFKWKCSLQKMPESIIEDMALRLDGEVLAKIVSEYNGREAEVPQKTAKAIHLGKRLLCGSQEGSSRGFLFMVGGEPWRRFRGSRSQQGQDPLWSIRGICTKS